MLKMFGISFGSFIFFCVRVSVINSKRPTMFFFNYWLECDDDGLRFRCAAPLRFEE